MSQAPNHGMRPQAERRILKNKPVMIIAFLLVIGLILLLLFSSSSGGDKQASEVIRKFENAIAAEDTEALKKLLSVDDEAMEMTDERLRQLIQYAKEERDYYEATLQIMMGQQALLEEAEYVNTGLLDKMSPDQLLNSGELYLKKKKGFWSDSYTIGVRPQYLNITLENDNGTITVDGKETHEVSKGNHSVKLGPLFPGEYQVDFKTKFDYVGKEITESEPVSLLGMESETDYSKMVTGDQVRINSRLGEVQAYVNDQPTPFIQRSYMDDSSGDYFYPAFSDGSQKIYGVAKFPWGESKSEPVVIDDLSDNYDITPPLQEQTRKEVLDFVTLFLETRAEAYGSKDISELEKLYPNFEGDLLQMVEADREDMYYPWGSDNTLQSVKLQEFRFTGSEDPADHVAVFYDREKKHFFVQVTGIHAFYALTISDGDVDDIDNDELLNLNLVYTDGKWTVSKIF